MDSFSILHTLAYSVIALQELNLNYRYNPLYWNTACLTVNSGSVEDEDDENESRNVSTNYGKVASAIGKIQKREVKIGLPDINKAAFGFKPDFDNNQIIYGLKGLVGIGDEVSQQIIANRPYASFDDFLLRMYDTGIIKKGQALQLIKAGCFDSFGDRMDIMKQFINKKIHTPKEKLNMQNFNKMVENNLIPTEHKFYVDLFKFRKEVTNKIHRTEGKDNLYKLNEETYQFFDEHFTQNCIVDFHNGLPVISEKLFKKEYDKLIEGIKEWMSSPDTLSQVNEYLFQLEWDSNAAGTVSKWEMDSLSFYYTEHELAHVNAERYGIANFHSLSEDPKVVGSYSSKNVERPKFKIDGIVGTVLDKDKNKHTVALLTPDGVITLKYYDGAFAHYNRQVSRTKTDGSKEILEKSWFTRGNKLFVCGYRRGSQFRPYRYNDTKYKHSTMLITDVLSDGTLKVKQERTKI